MDTQHASGARYWQEPALAHFNRAQRAESGANANVKRSPKPLLSASRVIPKLRFDRTWQRWEEAALQRFAADLDASMAALPHRSRAGIEKRTQRPRFDTGPGNGVAHHRGQGHPGKTT